MDNLLLENLPEKSHPSIQRVPRFSGLPRRIATPPSDLLREVLAPGIDRA